MRLQGPGYVKTLWACAKSFNLSGTSLKNRAIKALTVTKLRGQTRLRYFFNSKIYDSVHLSIHPSTHPWTLKTSYSSNIYNSSSLKVRFKENVRSLEHIASTPTISRGVTEGGCQWQGRNSPTPKQVSPGSICLGLLLTCCVGFPWLHSLGCHI